MCRWRILLALFIFANLLTLSHAQRSKPTVIEESATVDAHAFGVLANGKDCSIALQKAVDHALDLAGPIDGGMHRAVVFVPSSRKNYLLENPVWIDNSRVEIVGGGLGRTVFETAQFPARPAFIVGLPRGSGARRDFQPKQVYGQLNASDRFDLFGRLDTSLASHPKTRFGLRLPKDGMVQVQVGPLVRGWESLKQMTLEVCLATRNGEGSLGLGQILGRGNDISPAPWILRVAEPGFLNFEFRTAELSGPDNPRRSIRFPVEGKGFSRISIQIDLMAASAQAYVNGVQVAVTNHGVPWPAGNHFTQEDSPPFIIGEAESPDGKLARDRDISILGFLISNKLRYKDSGPGKRQTCLESHVGLTDGTPNDSYRYGPGATSQALATDIIIRYLGSETPSGLDRLVAFQRGPGAFGTGFVGYILNKAASGGPGTGGISGNAFRGFSVVGAAGLNQCIAVGNVLDLTIENVRVSGGWHGIGSINLGANYPVDVMNCRLSGVDAAYYGFWQYARIMNTNFEDYTYNAARFVGSSSVIRGSFVRDSQTAECFFKYQASQYGGQHLLDDVKVNTEGDRVKIAAIYMEQHPFTQSMLTVRDCYIGTTGSAPVIKLVDMVPLNTDGLGPGTVVIENVSANTSAAFLEINGPSWYGRVQIPPGHPGKGVVDLNKFAGERKLQIIDFPGRKER